MFSYCVGIAYVLCLDCRKAVQDVKYRCPTCQGNIRSGSRGQSVAASVGQGPFQPIDQSRQCAIAAKTLNAPPVPQVRQGVATAPSVKRVAPQDASASEPQPANICKQVDVIGQRYTALSWFLNTDNPTPKQCRIARSACCRSALVLSGGHNRALSIRIAKIPPATPMPLCCDRGRVGSTEVGGARIRRADGDLDGTRLSQVFVSVVELEKVREELEKR